MPGSSVSGTAFWPSGSEIQMSREPFSSDTKSSFLPSGERAGWYSSLVPLVSCRSSDPSAATIQMLRDAMPCCFSSLRREWKTRCVPSGVQDGMALEPEVTTARALPSSARLGDAAARPSAPSTSIIRPVMSARLSGRDGFAIRVLGG